MFDRVTGVWLRPSATFRVSLMMIQINLDSLFIYYWRADFYNYVPSGSQRSLLVAAWSELIYRNSQRPTSRTCRALGTKQCGSKTSPTLIDKVFVVLRRHLDYEFIAELPVLVWQVSACSWWRDVFERTLHFFASAYILIPESR